MAGRGEGGKPMSARDHALVDLDARRLPSWPPALKPGRIRLPKLDPRARGMAEHLAIGVVKNLLQLQFLIEHFSGRSLRSIDPLVQKILALGMYQLRHMPRLPAAAVVSESVEQTRRFGVERAGGLVNAVLRNLLRGPEPTWPDEKAEPYQYARKVLSFPPQVVEKLAGILGLEGALALCRHDNAEPPVLVRLMRGRTIADLAAEGVEASAHEAEGICVARGARKGLLAKWALEGVAQAQDATSAAVVGGLDLTGVKTALDRCCGNGTKTLQLWERLGPEARIDAMDLHARRCRNLKSLLRHRQIGRAHV